MRNVPHQALKERCSWGSPASRAWRGAEASTPNAWSSRWWTRTPPCSSARARARLRARRARSKAPPKTFRNSNSAYADSEESHADAVREDDEELGDASYASASRLAGAAAASAALDAFAPGTPRRLVAHHDGKSHSHFRDAFVTAAAARGVPSVDVVDVEREPSSVTGRVLRWDKEHGVDAPARGNTWALSETRAPSPSPPATRPRRDAKRETRAKRRFSRGRCSCAASPARRTR